MPRIRHGVAVLAAVALSCAHDPEAPPVEMPTHDIVFEGVPADVPELLVLDAADGSIRRLLAPGTAAMDPAPSPDGTRIAFVVADLAEGTSDLFVVNRDGSGLRRLTSDPEIDDQPAWSPDGRTIAFRSYRSLHSADIWLIPAEGGDAVDLTPDPLPGVTEEARPAWSPDGSRLAYAGNEGGSWDIWTIARDGSDKRQVTSTQEYDTEPAWSPAGDTIAFRRSFPAQGSDIHLVAASGGVPRPLVLAGEQRLPVWSADGAALVIVHHAALGVRPDLYSLSTDGSGPRPLVTDAVAGGSLNPALLLRPR